MARVIAELAEAVRDRSGGRCEAVWQAWASNGTHRALLDVRHVTDPAGWLDDLDGFVVTGIRCERRAEELQHRLARSRGRTGDEHLLDLAGDADNLADLCRACHAQAHARPALAVEARLSGPWGSTHAEQMRRGIIVEGSVTSGPTGWPVYVGPHPRYRELYPIP